MEDVKKFSRQSDIEDDESIAIFVHPDEYQKNPNQVASVSVKRINLVRGKNFAIKPFSLEHYPLEQCSSIKYETRYALLPMVLGVLCVLAFAVVAISPIPAGTSVPVGALAIAAVYGVTLVRGIKRHRITFVLQGDKTLRWQSKAGEYKYKTVPIQRLVSFAKKKGLFSDGGRSQREKDAGEAR